LAFWKRKPSHRARLFWSGMVFIEKLNQVGGVVATEGVEAKDKGARERAEAEEAPTGKEVEVEEEATDLNFSRKKG